MATATTHRQSIKIGESRVVNVLTGVLTLSLSGENEQPQTLSTDCLSDQSPVLVLQSQTFGLSILKANRDFAGKHSSWVD